MIEELQLRSLSPVTKETYVRAVERFARYFHRSPEKLGPEQVRDYLLHLANDNHANANTLLLNRAALRFVYVSTLKQKWFDDEIARAKRRPTLPPILSVEEVTRILDHTRNLKHWTILATFYATALRCNERRHLKVTDLDSKRMVIHVREGKGGIAREIALSPTLLERLRIYFRWRRPTDWLFPSKQRHNQPLDDGSIRHLCRNAGRRAGIARPVFPHLECTPKMRHEVKGTNTLNGARKWICPELFIAVISRLPQCALSTAAPRPGKSRANIR
jgi:site-specific recombinase XerD